MKSFFEVTRLAWKDSFKGSLWKWLVGGVGSAVCILLFGKNFFELTLLWSVITGISFLLGLFLMRFTLFFMKNSYKTIHYIYKESVYGDAIILLRDSFAKVHFLRKKEQFNDPELMECMMSFCENLKIIFEKKTKSTCSVSIKVPIKGTVTEATIVKNLCRDTASAKKRDTDTYNRLAHSILGNTAYQKVLNNVLSRKSENLYYRNNNIQSAPDYENTSTAAYEGGVLPYKSELVHPLIPMLVDSAGNTLDCLGFICIDSDAINSFDDKYDVAIISGVADGIYDLLTYRNSLFTKNINDGKAA